MVNEVVDIRPKIQKLVNLKLGVKQLTKGSLFVPNLTPFGEGGWLGALKFFYPKVIIFDVSGPADMT